jgi:hypothetical protein
MLGESISNMGDIPLEPKKPTPFWESTPFWGFISLIATIVLTVLGVRMKNLSELFVAAWICSIPVAVILWKGINGRKFRYSATLGTVAAIAILLFWIDRDTRPKEEPEKVPLEIKWQVSEPIDSKTPLSANQLNATAFANGHPVEGRFVYSPTLGSTLQPGTDTLSATFYPKDRDRYYPVEPISIAIVVKPPPTAP